MFRCGPPSGFWPQPLTKEHGVSHGCLAWTTNNTAGQVLVHPKLLLSISRILQPYGWNLDPTVRAVIGLLQWKDALRGAEDVQPDKLLTACVCVALPAILQIPRSRTFAKTVGTLVDK